MTKTVSTTSRRLTFLGLGLLSSLTVACAESGQQARSGVATANSGAAYHRTIRTMLPAPLSNADASLYRRIFALQDQGNWQQANRQIAQLGSDLLLGHVQFQRYMHPTAYRSGYGELAEWLERYQDHPGAYRAYSLAKQRQPASAAPLAIPEFGQEHLRHFLGAQAATPQQVRSAHHRETTQQIRGRIARSHLTVAERMIDGSDLPAEDANRLRAQVGLGWLALGKHDKAFAIAAGAAERARDHTSVPDWVAGLASFQAGEYSRAERHFRLYAASPLAGDWNKTAGAYWAARAAERQGKHTEAQRWLKLVTKKPYTFYGQLALEKLGEDFPNLHRQTTITQADIQRLAGLNAGRRIFALIQVGQIRLADEELLQLLSNAQPELARSIAAVAETARLPQSAMRGAFYLAGIRDTPTGMALYPAPDWQPQDGFRLDRALIWAFVRQESAFNPRATSWAGARGLMQLMPTTANYVAGEERFHGAKRDALYSPPLNLSLGQQYLQYLMNKELIGDDLFRLAVAYNAGIGNLLTWQREGLLASDPLMFIETLPFLETRLFVERVLANYWIYRALMGQPRPSLRAVVEGGWPRYSSQDGTQVELAEDTRHAN